MPRSSPRAFLALAFSLLTVLTFLPLLASFIVPVQAPGSSFSFASAGDAASVTSGDGLNSLNRLIASGTDFFFGVGDYSYASSVTGDSWCSSFKAKYNNIEIGPGNHDSGEASIGASDSTRSYEKYLAGCPHSLSSPITCGPVLNNCYGKEFYFDYPSTSPLARFIMISPRIFNVTGVCATNCNSGAGTPCNDTYGCWPYSTNDPHYTWTANAIDNARAAGIRWVIIGMHKACISAGIESCAIGTSLFNMLVSKKVDIILQGHDHSYQRSKQLGFNASCPSFTATNSFVNYNSNCVVDDGSRGFYSPGAGSVVIIEGTFGAGYTTVNNTSVNGGANAAEAPYFVKLMGSNTPGNGHGFLKFTVASDRIDIASNFSGSFGDSFSIAGTPPTLTTSFTYSPNPIPTGSPATFTATAGGGIQPYSFSWTFGDGGSTTGATVTHTYSSPGSYNVVLTTTDQSSQTATSSQLVTVQTMTSFTFLPTDDAYVASDTPTTNFGSATSMIVDNSPVKHILLKFNVQVTGQVTSATLRLFEVDSSNLGGDFHTAPASWTEGTVNWNNAPAADPAIFYSLGPVSINTGYNVNMTSVVTGNGIVSIKVTSTSGDGSYFSTKEGAAANAPKLVVNVTSTPNNPPTITVPPAQSVNEQSQFSFTVSSTDDPSQTITLTALNPPTGSTFTTTQSPGSTTGTFSWTPSEAQGPGTYTVTFKATDNFGASSNATVAITVDEVNLPPTVNVPGPQTVGVGSTLTFLVTASDPDIPANTITLSASGLVQGMTFDPNTGNFSFTPSQSQLGSTYTVSFTGTDNGAPPQSSTASVSITVSANPPSLTVPGPQSVNEQSFLTFTVSATDSNDRTITITCGNCANLGASFSSQPQLGSATGIFSWFPMETQGPGTYTFGFTATNDLGGSSTKSVTVTVNEVNQAPVLSVPGPQVAGELSQLSFAASATDPDLPANTVTLACSNCASIGAGFNAATGIFSWTPSEAQGPGTYTVTFMATDNGSPVLSDTETVSITVNEVNSPPTISAPSSSTAVVNSTTTFTVTASDSDLPQNQVTLTATGLVSGMSFPPATGNPATGTFTFTPSTSQVGMTFIVTFTATDNGAPILSTSRNVTITVVPPSQYALVVSAEGKVFKYQNGTLTQIGQPVTTALRQAAWRPDGSIALIVGDAAVLIKYDGSQFTIVPTGLPTGRDLNAVAWKPDGAYALIGGSAGTLLKYDGVTLTQLSDPSGNTIRSISWHPNGSQALLVGAKGTMLVFQATGQITILNSGTSQALYATAWNPNGQYALTSGAGGVINKYNGTTVQTIDTTGIYDPARIVRAIAFNPSGTLALLAGDSGLVLTYDGSVLAVIPPAATNFLYSISWSGSTAYIVGGSGAIETYSAGVLKKIPSGTTSSLRGIVWKPA